MPKIIQREDKRLIAARAAIVAASSLFGMVESSALNEECAAQLAQACLASVGRVYVRVRVRRCASPAFTAVVRMNLLQMLGGRACVSVARSDP